jgi:hypothetical protein
MRSGNLVPVTVSEKPRLKLAGDGQSLILIRPSTRATPDAAYVKQALIARYGTLVAFACCWRLSYNAVCLALRPHADSMSGMVREVRQVLGLTSRPTAQACDQAYHKALVRREAEQ